MFETNSRYINIEGTSIKRKDGKVIGYKKRRFLPNGSDMILIQEITLTEGDRLDRISAIVTGDAEQFWHICDANNTMHPLELTSEPGSTIRIARPWG
jgi:hypothetical protein